MSLFISADGGPSGLGQEAESVSDLPGGEGAAKWGFLFSSSGLTPTPSFLYIQTPLTVCSRDGL